MIEYSYLFQILIMRFDKLDRQKVIDFLNKHYDANFVRWTMLNYQKLLTDQNSNTTVVIFGGTGKWHGIRNDFMDILSLLARTKGERYIILVEKKADSLDIFRGSLDIFVTEKDE